MMFPLRKIDCVMTRVPDLELAASFYERTFGLRRLWSDPDAIGLAMPETDAEIVLHSMEIPVDCSVHYAVDSVEDTVAAYVGDGCTVRVAPFDIAIGRCAVVTEPYGNSLALVDFSKGGRK